MEPIANLLFAFAPVGLIVAIAVLFERRTPAAARDEEGLRPLHALVLYLIGTLLIYVVAPIGHWSAASWATASGFGLFALLDLPVWLAVLVGVAAIDLSEWVAHYLMHRIPLLWRLHRVHHNDDFMDISTGFRFHPIEFLLRYLLVLAFIFTLGVPALSVGLALGLTIVFNAWQHANILMPGPLRGMQRVFVTPELHRVHHSAEPEHHDRNFGVIFSVWDRMFQTFFAPAEGQVLRYGLHGPSEASDPHRSLGGLLFEPFLGTKVTERGQAGDK